MTTFWNPDMAYTGPSPPSISPNNHPKPPEQVLTEEQNRLQEEQAKERVIKYTAALKPENPASVVQRVGGKRKSRRKRSQRKVKRSIKKRKRKRSRKRY